LFNSKIAELLIVSCEIAELFDCITEILDGIKGTLVIIEEFILWILKYLELLISKLQKPKIHN
jgi:hypothetical protein